MVRFDRITYLQRRMNARPNDDLLLYTTVQMANVNANLGERMILSGLGRTQEAQLRGRHAARSA